MSKTQEIAVATDNGAQLPAFLASTIGQGSGLQGLTSDDYVVPRIKLLQGISDEVKNKLPGAEAGIFWLNVLDKPLGNDLQFVVISNNIRVLLLAPRDDGQGILARADDGVHWKPEAGKWSVRIKGIREPVTWVIDKPTVAESGLLSFGTSIPGNPDSNPAATKFYDYLVYLPEHDTIAVLSLARSQAKKAKDLNGKITLRRVDMNGQLFRAKIIEESSDSNTYSNYRFEADGYASEAVYATVKQFAKQYARYKIADEVAEDGGSAEAATGPVDSDKF